MYEGYQLANSNATRAYAGSTLPELMKVSEVLNQRYDASQEGLDAGSDLLRNAKVLPKDQALFAQRAGEYQDFIKRTSARPDLENVTQDVYRQGKQFAGEYRNFQQSLAASQKYQEDLDKGIFEGKYSKDRADKALAMSHDLYSGIQYDPATGRYSGQFRGIDPAHEVDKVEWVKKAVGDIAASSNSTVIERADGMYFRTKGGSVEKVTWDRIKPALAAAYSLDGKLQADINQDAEFNGHTYGKQSLSKLMENPDTLPVAQAALKLMKAGASEKEALSQVGAGIKKQQMENGLQDLAKKYIYSKTSSEDKFGDLTFEGKMAVAKAALPPDVAPLILPDAETRLTEKEKDPTVIKQNIQTADASLTNISARLAHTENLHPDEVADLRRQQAQLENTKYTQQHILDAAGDDAAKQLGYRSEAELLKTTRSISNTDNTPKVGGTYLGNKIDSVISTSYNGGISSSKVKLANGQITTINTKVAAPSQGNREMEDKFYQLKHNLIKDNAEHYAVKPSVVGLKPSTAKEMKTILAGSPSAAEWYEPGTNEPLKSSKIPKDFDITGMQIVKNGGSTYLKARELSTEAGKVGTPTGKIYTMRIGPGNNLGVVAAKDMLYQNGKLNADPDSRAAASTLLGGNWSGTLMSLQNNEKIPVTSSKGHTVGWIERKGYSTNPSGSRYLIYDSKGNDISQALGEDFRSDPNKMAGWIEKALAAEENNK